MRREIITINGEPRQVESRFLEDLVVDEVVVSKYPKDCYLEADSEGFYFHSEELYQATLQAKQEAEAKQAKLDALASLTVTTSNGNEFDADDVARQDMLSAIDASNTLGVTEQAWKMANNEWVTISLAELKEASALAIQAKGQILGS